MLSVRVSDSSVMRSALATMRRGSDIHIHAAATTGRIAGRYHRDRPQRAHTETLRSAGEGVGRVRTPMSTAMVASAPRHIQPILRIRRPLWATQTASRRYRTPPRRLSDHTAGSSSGLLNSVVREGTRTIAPKTAKTPTRIRPHPYAGRRVS